MARTKKNPNEARVNAACQLCLYGKQVSVMDLGKISATGHAAIAENPAISDGELFDKINAFVETIRKG